MIWVSEQICTDRHTPMGDVASCTIIKHVRHGKWNRKWVKSFLYKKIFLDFGPKSCTVCLLQVARRLILVFIDLRKQRACPNKSRMWCRNKHKSYLWACRHIREQSGGMQRHQRRFWNLSSCIRTSLRLAPRHLAEPPHTWARTSQPKPAQLPPTGSSPHAVDGPWQIH